MANREGGGRAGRSSRGGSRASPSFDDETLLATRAYIDLNPEAAGIAAVPETSAHTSILRRLEHVEAEGRGEALRAAQPGSVAAVAASSGLEERHWLCPIGDRRGLDSAREGMIEGCTLGNYLLLVESTGRLFRAGKVSISGELAGVFSRLGINAESWLVRLLKLGGGRLLGRFCAASRLGLREMAEQLGLHHLANLGGARPAHKRALSGQVRAVVVSPTQSLRSFLGDDVPL